MRTETKSRPSLRFPEFEDSWKALPLSKIADVKGGKRIPLGYSLEETNNGLPYITVSDMKDSSISLTDIRYVPLAVKDFIQNYKISTRDIYVSVAGTLGLVGIIPDELEGANLTENANKLTNLKCEQRYLLQYLKSWRFEKLVKNAKTTSAQPKLAIYALNQFRVGLPSLPEQRKIAAFLSAVDKKIGQLAGKKDLLLKYRKGVMQQIFDQKIRFKDDSGNDFPDWEEKEVSAIAPLQRGFDLPLDKMVEGDFPVVFSNGILRTHKEPKAKGPGVVTGRSGTIGKVMYVEKDYWPHNTSLWVTDFKGNHPKFILYFYVNFKLEKFATGSGVPTLNRNDIHNQKVLIPASAEQIKIADFFSTLDEKIELIDQHLEKTKTFKKGLLQQMFV